MKRYVWVLAGICSVLLANQAFAGTDASRRDPGATPSRERPDGSSRPQPQQADVEVGQSWCVEVDGGLVCGWDACGTTDEMSTCDSFSTSESSNEEEEP